MYCYFYNILLSLISRRTCQRNGLVDFCATVRGEILIHVQVTANTRSKCAIEVKRYGISAVFKRFNVTRLEGSFPFRKLPCYLSTFDRLSFPRRWY